MIKEAPPPSPPPPPKKQMENAQAFPPNANALTINVKWICMLHLVLEHTLCFYVWYINNTVEKYHIHSSLFFPSQCTRVIVLYSSVIRRAHALLFTFPKEHVRMSELKKIILNHSSYCR